MVSPLVQAMTYQGSVQPAQSGIAPTDVVGAYKLASDVAEKNYQAQLAKQNALWGGLAGLGGAGIAGFGPSAAKALFGTPAVPKPGDPATPGFFSQLFGSGANTAAGASPAASDAAAAGAGAADAGALPATSAPASFGGFGLDAGASAALPTFGVDALGGAGGAGSVAADMGLGASAPAAGGVAADLAAAVPAAAGAGDVAAAGIPDWLASFLPFLAAA